MVSQIAHDSQTSMVEVKTGLSLYTVELGNPDGAPMLVLHGGWGPAENEEYRLDILSEEIRSKLPFSLVCSQVCAQERSAGYWQRTS